jgi:1,4-alpha-glucan branching enzyme
MTSLGKDDTVEFRFFRPGATEVTLAGDFNDWSERLPMRCDASGWWTLRLRLRPGEYRFRYVADGEWYTDFASHGIEVSKHGWNSMLLVPDRAARTHLTQEYDPQGDADALLVT